MEARAELDDDLQRHTTGCGAGFWIWDSIGIKDSVKYCDGRARSVSGLGGGAWGYVQKGKTRPFDRGIVSFCVEQTLFSVEIVRPRSEGDPLARAVSAAKLVVARLRE